MQVTVNGKVKNWTRLSDYFRRAMNSILKTYETIVTTGWESWMVQDTSRRSQSYCGSSRYVKASPITDLVYIRRLAMWRYVAVYEQAGCFHIVVITMAFAIDHAACKHVIRFTVPGRRPWARCMDRSGGHTWVFLQFTFPKGRIKTIATNKEF